MIVRQNWKIATLVFVSAASAFAEEPALKVKWGAYLDTYYAYDFSRPGPERIFITPQGGSPAVYMTQPSRQNEFNVNLAFIDAKIEGESIHGRLALQTGTSVQANYAAETSIDSIRYGGGSGITRYLQEAYAGYEVAPNFWIDGGIFFSHIGFESWISRDNWTYTRSLAAENSPYYQTGIRLTYQFSNQWSAQFHVLNGWQNINETNAQKAIGTQVSWTPNSKVSVVYNTFLGNENGTRFFQDLWLKYVWSERFQTALVMDYGIQDVLASQEVKSWGAATLLAKYQLTSKVSFAGRIEKYLDPHSIIIAAAPVGFNAWGASLGVDSALHSQLVWRNEVRGFLANDPIFPSHSGVKKNDLFVVTSLALTI